MPNITPTYVAILAAVAGVVTVVVKAWPWVAKAVHLIDDLYGTDARPGVPAIPGVVARIASLEHDVSDTKTAAESAAYHSAPNGGGSAFDARTRQIEAMSEQVSSISADVQHVSDQVARHVEESKTWVRAIDDALGEHGIDTPAWPTS